jgi:hypothetical protein
MARYTIWSDSDSERDWYEETDSLEYACEKASEFVHAYDGEPYRVIVHIEDNEADETIDTYENINPCDCMYETLYGGK